MIPQYDPTAGDRLRIAQERLSKLAAIADGLADRIESAVFDRPSVYEPSAEYLKELLRDVKDELYSLATEAAR